MKTTATKIVTVFMEALETKEFDKAATYLSDIFLFSGSTPLPLNKDQFIRYSSELAEGMPNLSYHFHDIQEVDDLLGEGESSYSNYGYPYQHFSNSSAWTSSHAGNKQFGCASRGTLGVCYQGQYNCFNTCRTGFRRWYCRNFAATGYRYPYHTIGVSSYHLKLAVMSYPQLVVDRSDAIAIKRPGQGTYDI